MILLGYEVGSRAYWLYNPVTQKLCVSCDVVFEEGRQWEWGAAKVSESQVGEIFTVDFKTHRNAEADDGDDVDLSPLASRNSHNDCLTSVCRDTRNS